MHFEPIAQSGPRRPRLPSFGGVASLILVICGVLLWAVSLDQINLQQMDDTGLISVLPPAVLLGLFIVNASFCLAISQRPLPLVLLVLHIVVLVFMLY